MTQGDQNGQNNKTGMREQLREAVATRPIWQGEAGAVFPDHLHLHGLKASGRTLVTALPGKPGDPQPPELTPGQNPAGLTPQRLIGLLVLGLVFGIATSLLGLVWWLQLGLGLLLLMAYITWPSLKQVQVIQRWAHEQEAVTLLLSGEGGAGRNPAEGGVTVRTVYPSDSATTLVAGGHGVALVVYGLPAEERVKLVRQVLGYQAMQQVGR